MTLPLLESSEINGNKLTWINGKMTSEPNIMSFTSDSVLAREAEIVRRIGEAMKQNEADLHWELDSLLSDLEAKR